MSDIEWRPCPSVARAVLSAVESDGALLRCGLQAGHDGEHRFEMSWRDPPPMSERSGLVSDEIERYLASRRDDPDFKRRLHERMERDAEILRRLSDTEDHS